MCEPITHKAYKEHKRNEEWYNIHVAAAVDAAVANAADDDDEKKTTHKPNKILCTSTENE